MKIEGEHRFTNGIAISEFLESERIKPVLQHELVHHELYTKTTFGQMILMLEKNSLIHEESRIFKDILFAYTNRMQERTAVNIETIRAYADNGITAYTNAIERLKARNKNYYNYFRKLCCINGKIKTEEDAEVLANVLRGIARIAMNVKPELIPIDKYNESKSLKKYFNDPCNNPMISPNKRFDILINVLYRKNDNNNDMDSVVAGSIDFDKMEDYDYIHNEALNQVSKIYKDNMLGERLTDRLKTICIMSFDFEGAEYLSVKPSMINTEKQIYIKAVNTQEELVKLAKLNNALELFVAHSIRGFEEIHAIGVYGYENNKKMMYILYTLNQNEFLEILSSVEFSLVFYKTKFWRKEGKSIRKMTRKLPIYIYEDSPMVNDLSFLSTQFFNGKYGFIEKNNKIILVVCKRSVIYMANIVPEARKVLIKYFNEKNIQQTTDVEKICNVLEVCRIDEKCNEYETSDAKFI